MSAGNAKKLAAEELKFAKLDADVKELLGSAVGVIMLIGGSMQNPRIIADGLVVGRNVDAYTVTLVNLARKYEWMYNSLHALCETGVWGEFLAQTVTMTVAIATIHGAVLPPQTPGVMEGKQALSDTEQALQQAQLAQASQVA